MTASRPRRWVSAWLGLTVAATLGVVGLTASPALAYTCSTDHYNQVGWSTIGWASSEPASGAEGSSSYINTRDTGNWCSTGGGFSNFSTSWNMVQGKPNGHPDESYAQGGLFALAPNECPEAWAEIADTTAAREDWYWNADNYDGGTCLALGGVHAYRNLIADSGTGHYVRSTFDSFVMLDSLGWFDPFVAPLSWLQEPYGFDVDWFGEDYFRNTDVPGNSSTHVNYTSMGVQAYTDDVLRTTCNNIYLANRAAAGDPNETYFKTSATNCSNVNVWSENGQ